MKKNDKISLLLAGAGVLVALYAFMPKGDGQGAPGSSGGLGGIAGGLPGGSSGGGGADTPTVNIDFPAFPPFIVPEEPPEPGVTKKEAYTGNVLGDYTRDTSWKQYIGVPPSNDYSTYTAPSWKDPSNPNMTSNDIQRMIQNAQAEPTKKEKALTASEQFPWLFGIFGDKPAETQKANVWSVPWSSQKYTGGLLNYRAVTETKKEASINAKSTTPFSGWSPGYSSHYGAGPVVETKNPYAPSYKGGGSTGKYDQWGALTNPN